MTIDDIILRKTFFQNLNDNAKENVTSRIDYENENNNTLERD
jgi:hypothetical protein